MALRSKLFEEGRLKGRVGKLIPDIQQEAWESIEDPEERNKFIEDRMDHIQQEVQRFRVTHPQVILDETEAGQHNFKVLADWTKAHGVAGEYQNLVEAMHDCYRQLTFQPSVAGRPELGKQASGQHFENKLNAEQFDWLLQPHAPYAKADLYEPRLSAAAYKAKHPEAWKFQTDQVAAYEVAYVTKEVDAFLQLRPAFISTDENRKMLLDAVKDAGLKINQTSLMLSYDNLVKSGRIKSNDSVSFKLPGITRTDFAEAIGEDSGRESRLSAEQVAALKFVKSHSSKQIAERTQNDPAFRAALNRLKS
jgi:hypothetical protein